MPFHVRRLNPDDALPTLALARLEEPDLTPEAWRDRLAQPEDRGGAFAAFRRNAASALLSYDVAASPDGGDYLLIRALAAFDLVDPERVARILVGAVCERQQDAGRRVAWAPTCPATAFQQDVARAASLHSIL